MSDADDDTMRKYRLRVDQLLFATGQPPKFGTPLEELRKPVLTPRDIKEAEESALRRSVREKEAFHRLEVAKQNSSFADPSYEAGIKRTTPEHHVATHVTDPSLDLDAYEKGINQDTIDPAEEGRFSTAALARKATPDRDLARLPAQMNCKQMLAYMNMMVKLAEEYDYIAKQDIPERSVNAVLYGVTMQTLRLMYDHHGIARRVARDKVTDASLAVMDGYIVRALDVYSRSHPKPASRKARKDLNQIDSDMAMQLSLLNPMVLTGPDMGKVGSRIRIENYGLNYTGNIAMRRSRNILPRHVVPTKIGRMGAGIMEPISSKLRGYYWMTYECHFRGHGDNPLYKYHALAWGRALYRQVLDQHKYDVCPIYGVPAEDFTNNGAAYLSNDDTKDLRYLQLAELDWRGLLDGVGGLYETNNHASVSLSLPTYKVEDFEKYTPEDFAVDRRAVPFQYLPANLRPGWVGYGPLGKTVTRMALGWHILTEKVRHGLLDPKAIAPLDTKPTYKKNEAGKYVPDPEMAGKPSFSPADKMKLIKVLNDECTVIDYEALAHRTKMISVFTK